MARHFLSIRAALFLVIAGVALLGARPAMAQSHLDQDSAAALKALYDSSPGAKALGAKAKGVLVFPDVRKAGFIIGAQGGDGVFYKKGKTAGYYSTGAASVGLQAGAQSYGYALFFMTDSAVKHLETSSGWAIGTGPSIVIVDAGAAKDMSTLTGKSDVYAFIFDQRGLMAGVGLQGSKITRLKR